MVDLERMNVILANNIKTQQQNDVPLRPNKKGETHCNPSLNSVLRSGLCTATIKIDHIR